MNNEGLSWPFLFQFNDDSSSINKKDNFRMLSLVVYAELFKECLLVHIQLDPSASFQRMATSWAITDSAACEVHTVEDAPYGNGV